MNSFVNIGLSLQMAVWQSVTMPALFPPSAQLLKTLTIGIA